MGGAQSGNYEKIMAPDDFGEAPEDIAGIISYGKFVALWTKSRLFEIRTTKETVTSRIMNLETTCCASTPDGKIVIGFATGQISLFDFDLNLITSFVLPGGCRAHNGKVTHVTCSGNPAAFYFFSIGTDKSLNIWDKNGVFVNSMISNGNLTALAASDDYIWFADSHTRIHVINMEDMSSSLFEASGVVTHLVTFAEGQGCLAAIDDGSVDVISCDEVVSHFPFNDGERITSIIPLQTEKSTGLISYATVDSDGNFALRVLEFITCDIGQGLPFMTSNEKQVITINKGRLVYVDIKKLMNAAVKNIGSLAIELPRHRIVEFL